MVSTSHSGIVLAIRLNILMHFGFANSGTENGMENRTLPNETKIFEDSVGKVFLRVERCGHKASRPSI